MSSGFDPKLFQEEIFEPGETILREGEQGHRAYIIKSGRVEIAKRLDGGRRKVLGTIGPGGVFGEMALIDDKPRMADAMALEDTICIVIRRDQFRERLDRTDPFIRALLRILVQNIRSMAGSA